MLDETPVDRQLAAAATDPLRVLVVGAGVAGLTVAGLLRQQGLHPVVVERAPHASGGYMLALMPLVDPVLDALGVRDRYAAGSTELHRFRIRDRAGAPVTEYEMGRLLDRFGEYRGIDRGELLDVLSWRGGQVAHGTTVESLDQHGSEVHVTLDDGTGPVDGVFDLVVAADGLHSTTRRLVLPDARVATYDSGWGGWVTWVDTDDEADLGEELWGAGLFVGSYPVLGRLGVIVGGPRGDTAVGADRFVADARATLRAPTGRLGRVLDGVAGADDTYYWSLTDCRAETWSVGRVVLLGDAAAGFLPTAGIGACMAMESAWVLAGHLAGATADRLPQALAEYERAQRPRVEAAQDNSRQLARLLFIRSRPLAALRDVATRFVSLETALGPIRKLLERQPQPPTATVPRPPR